MAFTDLQFTETDARVLADRFKSLYEEIRRKAGEPGYKLALADPERLVQLTESAVLAQVATDLDLTGKGNLLYFARADTIEHIGYLYGERGKKLDASFALTTMRYGLAMERTVITPIPKGSRTTPNNKVFFATTKPVEIPAGELYVDVEAKASLPGLAGDGFAAGTIKNMVDIYPFVATAENITPSSGGAEEEDIEAYRGRLWLLPESFSVAGPDGAYKFWTRTANPGIVDVEVWMPELDLESFAEFLEPWGITNASGFYTALYNYFRESGTGPGNVDIACLMQDGELPSQEVKDQVYETLSARNRRPLTDFVHVKDPEPIEYGMNFKYWISTDRATEAASIIQEVNNVVDRFVSYQKSRLGLDIVPDLLRSMLITIGVKRTEIYEPVYTVLEPRQVGIQVGDRNVVYGGLEDA